MSSGGIWGDRYLGGGSGLGERKTVIELWSALERYRTVLTWKMWLHLTEDECLSRGEYAKREGT